MTLQAHPPQASRGMSSVAPHPRLPCRPGAQPPAGRTSAVPTPVEILVCGNADRHDDGAPLAAAEVLRPRLGPDTSLRVVGQLDVDDLLAVAPDGAVVVVDAASGLRAGEIVELPLDGLIGRDDDLRPRSSHALAFREVIGVATLIRRFPLRGRIVAIGGSRWSLGIGLSPRVGKAIPAFAQAVLDAVDRVRE
jgi:hydrogenase maturation protease